MLFAAARHAVSHRAACGFVHANGPILATKPSSGTKRRGSEAPAEDVPDKRPGREFRTRAQGGRSVPERGFVAKITQISRTRRSPPHAAARNTRRNRHAAQNAASTGSLTRTRSWPRSSSVSFASSGAWVPSSMRSLSVTSSANPVSSTFAPQSAAMRVNCS